MVRFMRLINEYLKSKPAAIPYEYRNDLRHELIRINIRRTRVMSMILIVVSITLLFIDIEKYNALQLGFEEMDSLLVFHVLLLLAPLIYLFILSVLSKRDDHSGQSIDNKSYIVYIIVILSLCSLLSIHSNTIHQQAFPYYIAVFCIASVILFSPSEHNILYAFSSAIFILGIISSEGDPDRIFQLVFFSVLQTIIAVIISHINYCAFVDNYINKRLLHKNSEELKNMCKVADEMLKKRTEDLTKANNKIIQEMNMKYEMEMQILKATKLCKEKEKALNKTIEYEKLRTVFFANISHELRTPLNLIYSSQQMIDFLIHNDKVTVNDDEIAKYMHITKQNCHRLIRLIANLIDITKIDAGYFQINPVNCDIIKVVEDITLSVAKYIEDRQINLIFDTEVEERVITFDPDKVERIILNLLSNAIKFTPKGGSIFVNINNYSDKVVISVKDTGIGIPLEMKKLIFERFVQVDDTTSRNREGSGIGLSLVKSLVEMHNGKISVISELGKGSEFIIEIPAVTIPSRPAAKQYNMLDDGHNVERINIEFSDIYP